MFVLKVLLCLVWQIPLGFSSGLAAQNASSERFAPQLIYSSFGQFQDYEKRFGAESKNRLPDGISPQQLVDGFTKACRIINSILQEIEIMQKELQELNCRLENLRRTGNLSYYILETEKENGGTPPQSEERGVLSDDGEAGAPAGVKTAAELRTRIGLLQERIVQKKLLIQSLYAQTQEWIAPVWNLAPQKPEVLHYMLFLLACAMDSDQYEAAYVLSRELMAQNVYEHESVLYEMAGISAFMVGKLDVAQFCFKEALKRGTLAQSTVRRQELIPYCSQAWKTELAFREGAKAKGELPRILLETTKGNVEIELFENSFPGTVSAFIGLVKSGFYDGKSFSTVISGKFARLESVKNVRDMETANLQNAEVCLRSLASAEDESKKLSRSNLRGSLVLLPGKDGATGRFEILLTPAPERDGRSFVFGRVVKGMDVVSSFVRSDGADRGKGTSAEDSDRIFSAKALNR